MKFIKLVCWYYSNQFFGGRSETHKNQKNEFWKTRKTRIFPISPMLKIFLVFMGFRPTRFSVILCVQRNSWARGVSILLDENGIPFHSGRLMRASHVNYQGSLSKQIRTFEFSFRLKTFEACPWFDSEKLDFGIDPEVALRNPELGFPIGVHSTFSFNCQSNGVFFFNYSSRLTKI